MRYSFQDKTLLLIGYILLGLFVVAIIIPMLYIGGDTVVCDDLSCHYYLHSGRWRSLALPLLAAVQENIDLNLADFRLDGGQYNPPYEASTYPDDPYYWGRILECGLNQGGVWTRSNGRTYNAQFSYDSSQNYEPWIRCCLESHGTLVLPEGTREVRAEALEGTAANRAVLPASCESIESGAFAGMDLWCIEIPAQSTDIDPNAFGNGHHGSRIRCGPVCGRKGIYAGVSFVPNPAARPELNGQVPAGRQHEKRHIVSKQH